jgi:hypothetical protein
MTTYTTNIPPVLPHKSFASIHEATPSQIHVTWGAFDRMMAGRGRQVITNQYVSRCACCGGTLLAGEQIRWI